MKSRPRTSFVCVNIVASMLIATLTACASSTAAKQPPSVGTTRRSCAQRVLPSLVFADPTIDRVLLADAPLAGRNDARLGSDRQPFIRVSESNRYWAYDQYWIVNGRTFQNYQLTTSSKEHLVR